MTRPRLSSLFVLSLMLSPLGCDKTPNATVVTVPSWAKDAVWYQIFPERFRNGTPANDPTIADLEFAGDRQWHISPWTSDWYALQPWESSHDSGFYRNVFDRRYGGDLQGVLESLDYLSDLGVTAIYFNPVFEAYSLHKYDASTYHHIDDNFGEDPSGDRSMIAAETNDPGTWTWTSADKLFLRLIEAAHARGIRIIIDGVFNHSGTRFWAFEDVIRNQAESPYSDWYDIRSWDDPTTAGNEFDYKGWWDYKTLPEFAEGDSGFVPAVRDYFFDITRRWMDPNGDGDPSDGIDGWRLDVANEVSPVFWKEWRSLVKTINPDAYIVGEIWDDASHWLSGDQFDAVMNYRFARACVQFFIDTDGRSIDAAEFDDELEDIRHDYPPETNFILQNLFDSHDTDRLASMIRNPNRNYDDKNGPRSSATYDVRSPSSQDRSVQRLMALFQMTYVGAPMIYYGTESGMWGADDPDDRKPMVWPDMTYEPEAVSPSQKPYAVPDTVGFDASLFGWYRTVIHLRHDLPALRRGTYRSLLTRGKLYVFERTYMADTVVVAINAGSQDATIALPLHGVWDDRLTGIPTSPASPLKLPAFTGAVLTRPRQPGT